MPAAKFMYITPSQCRAARMGLGWNCADLAKESQIDEATIIKFERGTETPPLNSVAAIKAALENGGIRFTANGCICLPEL